MTDKGANIKLQGEDEGFAFSRDLIKEDGKAAVVGETLPFKVVELRRSTRRILLSHVRTYSEAKVEKAAAEADNTKKAVKKINLRRPLSVTSANSLPSRISLLKVNNSWISL